MKNDKAITKFNNLDRIYNKILEINKSILNKTVRPSIKHKCGLGTGISGGISVDGKIYACKK